MDDDTAPLLEDIDFAPADTVLNDVESEEEFRQTGFDRLRPRTNSVEDFSNSMLLMDQVTDKTHLVVVMPGLTAKTNNLTLLSAELVKILGPQTWIHVSNCDQRMGVIPLTRGRTWGGLFGIDFGGKRLADDIRDVCSKHQFQEISLIGISLGGLYCRYAARILFDSQTGLICGLKPNLFTTFATPHLGLGAMTHLDFISKWALYFLGPYFRTYQQLTKADNENILEFMRTDEFMKPLEAFPKRILFSNYAGTDNRSDITSSLMISPNVINFDRVICKWTISKTIQDPHTWFLNDHTVISMADSDFTDQHRTLLKRHLSDQSPTPSYATTGIVYAKEDLNAA